MVYYYWLGDKMLKALAIKFPNYYRKIGEPMYFGDLLSNWRAQNYLMDLTVKGVPKDFPSNGKILNMVQRARKVGIIALLLLVALFLVQLVLIALM